MNTMGEQEFSLGTDEINVPKILLLLLLSITMIVLSWYSFNVTAATGAMPYWSICTTVGLVWVISKVISKIKLKDKEIDFPNPIFYEKTLITGHELSKSLKTILFSGALIVGIFVFINISQTPTMQLIGSPTYQTIELGGNVADMLTTFSAFAEDFCFWMITPAIICGFLYLLFSFIFNLDRKLAFFIAVAITLIANPFVFTLFHAARYGTDNVPASEAVLLFGLVMTGWVVFTRTPWLPLFVHAPNNLAIQFFSHHATDVSFIGYTLIALVVLMTALYLWRLRKA